MALIDFDHDVPYLFNTFTVTDPSSCFQKPIFSVMSKKKRERGREVGGWRLEVGDEKVDLACQHD